MMKKMVLFQLFRRDLVIFWRLFPNKFLNSFSFFITYVIVWGYFMPKEWISDDYGPFLIVGTVAGFGFFQTMAYVSIFIADLEGRLPISHLLILPVRTAWIFGYLAFFWGVSSFLLSILLFPIAKI